MTHTGAYKTGSNFDQVQGWKIHEFINILVFWPEFRKLLKTDKHYYNNIDTDRQAKTKIPFVKWL